MKDYDKLDIKYIKEAYEDNDSKKRRNNEYEEMEKLLRILIDIKADYSARQVYYGKNAFEDDDFKFEDEVFDDFMNNYVIDSSDQMKIQVLKLLGRLKAENSFALSMENDKYRAIFDSEGDKGKKKAYLLSRSTVPGMYVIAIDTIAKYINNTIGEFDQDKCLFTRNIDFSELTRYQYYEMLGLSKTEIDKRLKEGNKKGDEPAYLDYDEEKDMTYANAIYRMRDDYIKKTTVKTIEKGADEYYAEKGLNEKESKPFKIMVINHQNEPKFSHIEDWLKTTGNALVAAADEKSAAMLINDIACKYNMSVSYDKYMSLHTGYSVFSKDEMIRHYDRNKLFPDESGFNALEVTQNDYLAKALAANMLKNSAEKFSIKKIHKIAEGIKKRPDFMQFIKDREAVKDALVNPLNINKTENELFAKFYVIQPDKVEEYIGRMNTLYENLMADEGRSEKYKYFFKSVEKISQLKSKYNLTMQKDKEACSKELKELNMRMMNGIEDYIKGKEKVRTFDDGKERFNNALDAVAVISECCPNVLPQALNLTEKINKIRDVKPSSSKYIDLNKYGDKRAAEAKIKRDLKKGKIPEMKVRK